MAIVISVISEKMRQTKEVRLKDFDTLTARAARIARTEAFGPRAHVTVTDGIMTYRVTKGETKSVNVR